MQVTLEDESGRSAGRIVVSPGKRLRVGRQAPADLAISDPFLSSLHFALECAADRCCLSDLGSRNGTFLNGAKIQEAVVHDGDLIAAGQTKFRVRIEAAVIGSHIKKAAVKESPATSLGNSTTILADQPLADQTLVLNSAPKHPLEAVLSAQPGEHLYALLDAARDDRVLELLLNSKEQYQSLYEGQQGQDLANYAPYLVELPQNSPFLATLLKEGWGKSWGIYLTSPKPFAEVRKHFRHFLLVQTEDGKQLYFRFYDPRVLRVFLAGFAPGEAGQFFGPVSRYLMEGEEPSLLLELTCSSLGAQETKRPLAS